MKISKTELRTIIQSVISEASMSQMDHGSHGIDLSSCGSVLECCKKMLRECPQMSKEEVASCIYEEYCQGSCDSGDIIQIIGCINECLVAIKNDQDAKLCCDCVKVMVCILDMDRCGGTEMSYSRMPHQDRRPSDIVMDDPRVLEKDCY